MRNNSRYFKAIALLTSGSLLGQIIGFVGSLFMTRLYSEAEIGIMTSIVAVSGIFGAVINGRFDFAIVKEQDEKMIIPLVALSLFIGILFSLFVSFFSLFYFKTLDRFLAPPLASCFVLIILLITAFTNVFRSYNNRVRDYKTMTWVIVFRRIAEEMSMVVLGLLSLKSIGLLFSRVVGQFFGMRQEIRNIKNRFDEITKVKWHELSPVFQRHKRQLYYSAPAALMNSASYSLISLFIGSLFGLDTLGIYAISFAVLGLPLSVISSNVSKVYFGEASQEYANSGTFIDSTKKTFFLLLPISLLMWAVMSFIVPPIVPWIYGKGYVEAGTYIRILSPMFAIRFISSSMNTGLIVANKQNVEVYIQILFVVAIFLSFVIARIRGIDVNSFLLLISILYSIIYAINFVYIYRLSNRT